MAENDRSSIKSVKRVFQLLELFSELKQPLTSVRVERQLGYPASSALALLKSMVQLGYLSFDRIDKTYFPTVRLTLLGEWIDLAVRKGHGSLLATIDRLIAATGESVSLSCQSDLDMQFIHVGQGPQHVTVNITPGTLAPLFRSSIGLTALSQRSAAEITRLAQRQNKTEKDKADRVDLAKVMTLVEGVRLRGWFAGYDMYIDGVGAISWALPAPANGRGMVLSVSGPTERIRAGEQKLVQTVEMVLKEQGVLAAAG
jgi:IclR family KDG regulon transcriptional repressor